MYKPKDIIEAEKKVSELHPLKNRIPPAPPVGDELEKLIMKLVSVPDRNLKMRAVSLSDEELRTVLWYLPHDFFKVNLDKLFQIISYRSTVDNMKFLFEEWQSSYTNRKFNQLAGKYLMNDGSDFVKVLNSSGLTMDEFAYWLKCDDVPFAVAEKSCTAQYSKYPTFEEKLKAFGILTGSDLFSKSENLFYIFCSKQDLLKVEVSHLYDLIGDYTDMQIHDFLCNLIRRFDITELRRFDRLLTIIQQRTGNVNTNQFNDFFDGTDPKTVETYSNWLNSWLVIRIFGNDSRGRYWSQFIFKNAPKKYKQSLAVVMEFEGYVVLEFIKENASDPDGVGPVYIYREDYYRKNIEYRVKSYGIRNNSLRSFVLDDFRDFGDDQPMIVYRKEHRGNWEAEITREIVNVRKMTKKFAPYARW